jgi:hypothetical protein
MDTRPPVHALPTPRTPRAAASKRTKLRPAWRAFDIGLAPCATFFSSAGRGRRAVAFAIPVPAPWIGSLFADLHPFLPLVVGTRPARVVWCAFCLVWPTTRHGAGSTDYRSGLCPLLVLRLSCLFRGCFIGTLLPTHRDEIVPSHNFDGHFPDSPQLYMCVLNERKKRAHVVYRGGRGSGGQYRVERELLYFSTHDS